MAAAARAAVAGAAGATAAETARAAAERAAAERAVEVSAMPRSAAASEVQAEVQVRTRNSSTARWRPGGGWYEELQLRHGGKGRPRRPRSS